MNKLVENKFHKFLNAYHLQSFLNMVDSKVLLKVGVKNKFLGPLFPNREDDNFYCRMSTP